MAMQTKVDGSLNTLTVIHSPHTPSWKRFPAKGTARFESRTHATAQTVHLYLQESSHEPKGTSRLTMMCLEADEAKALYEQLKLIFDEVPA